MNMNIRFLDVFRKVEISRFMPFAIECENAFESRLQKPVRKNALELLTLVNLYKKTSEGFWKKNRWLSAFFADSQDA